MNAFALATVAGRREGQRVDAERGMNPESRPAARQAGAGDYRGTGQEPPQPAADDQPGPDTQALRRFTERFAGVLVEAGIPRMPARVFAALLVSESGSLTAADLGERLQASAAAVSGGVRYLIGVGMISREGEPGSRRHHYRVPDNIWSDVISSRDRLLTRWSAVLRDGMELLGPDTAAGTRLSDSVQYFEFVSAELPAIQARWLEYKAARGRGDGRFTS